MSYHLNSIISEN